MARPGASTTYFGRCNLTRIENDLGHWLHALEHDHRRGPHHHEGYWSNDDGEQDQPASGVAGTSSACYPSHPPVSKFT